MTQKMNYIHLYVPVTKIDDSKYMYLPKKQAVYKSWPIETLTHDKL